jgi:hypothetical protein
MSVVSRDSACIALTIAALNDLQVMACDIQNAYLTADCREKIWIVAGSEFGSDAGTIILVKKALYGLKSAGATFQSLLADNLMDMGYRPTKADPEVWLRPATNPTGSNTTRWYCVMSTSNILSLLHNSHAMWIALTLTSWLKESK